MKFLDHCLRPGHLVCLLSLALAACGGGGGGGSAGVSGAGGAAALRGAFIDSAVVGIHYNTPTRSGVTDSAGYFDYLAGETVTFSIGAITFPAALAGPTVTPLSMSATADLADPVVGNVAYLLQALDADANPSNGIQLPASVAALATQAVDFSKPSTDFAADATVRALVVAAALQRGDASISTTPETATAHLNTSLLGLIDKDAMPPAGCDQNFSAGGTTRTRLPTNMWADVMVKPNNARGWIYDGDFKMRGSDPAGNLIRYQPAATDPEVIVAKTSDDWYDEYSYERDVWLRHRHDSNIVMRIAAKKIPIETANYPGFVGTAIYLHYKGEAGSFLEFELAPGDLAMAYFAFVGNGADSFFKGTGGRNGMVGDGDDGVNPIGLGAQWDSHQPGDPNFPPNLHKGGHTPYGRQLPASTCIIRPHGQVLLWRKPNASSDLLFSPASMRNFWRVDAPVYDDVNGYAGSMGLRTGVTKVNVLRR